jgi:hypothetical protein
MSSLNIRLLGDFYLELDGEPLPTDYPFSSPTPP